MGFKVRTTEYFGGCPHCGSSDGFLNFGRDHWGICHKHQVKWYIGSNLFSGWRDEAEEQWLRNTYRLSPYHQVEPIFPTCWTDSADEPSANIIQFSGAVLNPSLVGRFRDDVLIGPDDPEAA